MIKLTARDVQIRQQLKDRKILTASQIQMCLFGPDKSSCIRRLTKLYNNRIIDRLPRSSVSSPYIYIFPKTKAKGVLPLGHTLGINEIYVRIYRATQELGWDLKLWIGPDKLQPLLSTRSNLAPDGYFQIQREAGGEVKTSGFFIEYEHTVRSSNILAAKLHAYSDMFNSGYYRMKFGIRAMRVLVVYRSVLGYAVEKRRAKGVAVSERLGVTLVRFASLDSIRLATAKDLLTAPLWHKPGDDSRIPLFEV
jgi:hypothetical protein